MAEPLKSFSSPLSSLSLSSSREGSDIGNELDAFEDISLFLSLCLLREMEVSSTPAKFPIIWNSDSEHEPLKSMSA